MGKEIPFGAFDSELMRQEISIPEGFTATIEGDKIILTKTESEDERIRKAIIEYFESCNIKHLDWIDWLEKQNKEDSSIQQAYELGYTEGKRIERKKWIEKPKKMEKIIEEEFNKVVCPNDTWSEEDEDYYDAIIAKLEVTQDDTALTDNQMEFLKSLKDKVHSKQEWKQENTGDLTDFENAMMCVGNSFFGQYAGLDPNDTNAIKEQANLLLELVPNKEWSEEDENTIKVLMNIIRKSEMIDSNIYTDSLKEKLYDWLISLRPQPKQEWSGEDKEHVESILERLEGMCEKGATFTTTRFAVSQDIDWLKSLKDRVHPQNQWKPSEEQMSQLKWLAHQNADNMIGKELITLYEDLKKEYKL